MHVYLYLRICDSTLQIKKKKKLCDDFLFQGYLCLFYVSFKVLLVHMFKAYDSYVMLD